MDFKLVLRGTNKYLFILYILILSQLSYNFFFRFYHISAETISTGMKKKIPLIYYVILIPTPLYFDSL